MRHFLMTRVVSGSKGPFFLPLSVWHGYGYPNSLLPRPERRATPPKMAVFAFFLLSITIARLNTRSLGTINVKINSTFIHLPPSSYTSTQHSLAQNRQTNNKFKHNAAYHSFRAHVGGHGQPLRHSRGSR